MTQKTRVIRTCDVCAQDDKDTPDAEQIVLNLGERKAELDLCPKHRAPIDKLEPLFALAAQLNPPPRRRGRPPGSKNKVKNTVDA